MKDGLSLAPRKSFIPRVDTTVEKTGTIENQGQKVDDDDDDCPDLIN